MENNIKKHRNESYNKINKQTRLFRIELDSKLADKFQNKLDLLGIKAEICIVNLIKEYMDSEIENTLTNNENISNSSFSKVVTSSSAIKQVKNTKQTNRNTYNYSIDIEYEE